MVTYLLTNGSITLHFDGKSKLVAKGDSRFDKVITAIRENRLEDIPQIVDTEKAFADKGLELIDGLLQVDGESMPVELSDRILAYKEQDLPFDSLIKFWDNLKLNPSFNSRKQLFKFLENEGHSLTEDGCFIGYRGVTEDFRDKHTGTFDNRPGQVCEMPREAVDDNPDNACSFGLHVGGYNYAKSFGPKLVLVKVNPKDVVSVPNDYDGQKMRVCRFEVIDEAKDMVKSTVYGHDAETESLDEEASEESQYNDPDYSDDEIEEVLQAKREFQDTYSGESLFSRIDEEVNLGTDAIRSILANYAKED